MLCEVLWACIALHSAGDQGTLIWMPNDRKALVRGHLYLEPVEYVGIPNQLLMVEDAAVSAKGAVTYPHPSIVKVIERHVEMECAEADEIDLGRTLDSIIPVENDIRSTAPSAYC